MFLAISSDTSMTQAVANTLMGMGTVFAVLIFIALIISSFSLINKYQNKANDVPKVVTKPAEVPVPKQESNPLDDAQLVAVITAAIYAACAEAGTAVSKDSLIVRSIRRVK